jgi:hypothetical protein
MEIDPENSEQGQLSIGGEYDVLRPPQFHSPGASAFGMSPAHVQYTPPRNSPNVDRGQFGFQTSPQAPRFVGAHDFSPGQNLSVQQQQHPSITLQSNGGYEFSSTASSEVYSLSPQSPMRPGVTTHQRLPAQAGGYVNVSPPPPPGVQYPPHDSPVIQHQLHGQQPQTLQQPQYFAYGHASGQIQGAHGQVHSQTVAHANAYGIYPPQIPHSEFGVSVIAAPAVDPDEFINMNYTAT